VNSAHGALVIVTGPPGAGKTTIAGLLAAAHPRKAVHLQGDGFFEAVKAGFILPWLPDSHDQNRTLLRAMAGAARAYGEGGYEVYIDGVVGPWFLDIFRETAAEAGLDLHYVVLRPTLDQAIGRARDREINPVSDYPQNVFEGFADLGRLEGHAFALGEDNIEAVTSRLARTLAQGRFRLAGA